MTNDLMMKKKDKKGFFVLLHFLRCPFSYCVKRREGRSKKGSSSSPCSSRCPFSCCAKRRENGQMMLESIIAITMITVGLLGIITLLIRSSRQNRDVAFQLQATYLAVEGIEVVKHLIDTSISEELSGGGSTWNLNVPFLSSESEFYELDLYTEGRLVAQTGSVRRLRFDPVSGFFTHGGGGNETFFERKVEVIKPPNNILDRILVRSTVSWGGGEEHRVVLEDVFSYWRKLGGKKFKIIDEDV